MSGKITIEESKYPTLLKQSVNKPPEVLYYKGKYVEDIFENCIAVVGSRKITTYGRIACTDIVTDLALNGFTIVSGFMYGIDACAHKAAVSVHKTTIAVMPCGIDLVHPRYQQSLYNEIVGQDGIIVSEYENYTRPQLWMYVKRNRIVAGLSKAVLVVEAAMNSGSLITANFAINTGKPVFAIPGPINSETSQGTNELIKTNKAKLVTCAYDILKEFGIQRFQVTKKEQTKENKDEKLILSLLKRENADIDYITQQTQIPFKKLGAVLTTMQISGQIYLENNKYYAC